MDGDTALIKSAVQGLPVPNCSVEDRLRPLNPFYIEKEVKVSVPRPMYHYVPGPVYCYVPCMVYHFVPGVLLVNCTAFRPAYYTTMYCTLPGIPLSFTTLMSDAQYSVKCTFCTMLHHAELFSTIFLNG